MFNLQWYKTKKLETVNVWYFCLINDFLDIQTETSYFDCSVFVTGTSETIKCDPERPKKKQKKQKLWEVMSIAVIHNNHKVNGYSTRCTK